MSEPLIGEIKMFASNFAPRGWAFCDGQLLPVSQNNALFSLIGTLYGGDGRTTFGLPDLRGRVPMHAGDGPGLSGRKLGQRGGQENVTLTEAQMPSHTHTTTTKASSSARGIQSNTPKNAYWGPGSYTTSSNVNMAADAVVTSNTGGGVPVSNVQPYTVINFIICLEGIFPSRS